MDFRGVRNVRKDIPYRLAQVVRLLLGFGVKDMREALCKGLRNGIHIPYHRIGFPPRESLQPGLKGPVADYHAVRRPCQIAGIGLSRERAGCYDCNAAHPRTCAMTWAEVPLSALNCSGLRKPARKAFTSILFLPESCRSVI